MTPYRILVVDDQAATNDVVKLYLEAMGLKAMGVSTGAQAVEVCKTEPPDAVLMDVQMPVMDGLEATRRVRALPGGDQILIVGFTAMAMAGDRERCLASGMDDYFSKPIRMSELHERLVTLIESRKGRGKSE